MLPLMPEEKSDSGPSPDRDALVRGNQHSVAADRARPLLLMSGPAPGHVRNAGGMQPPTGRPYGGAQRIRRQALGGSLSKTNDRLAGLSVA